MTQKQTKQVTQEWVNKIEALQYEVNARKALLLHMVESGMSFESEGYQRYHGEYLDFYKQYEAAKEEFAAEYIYPATGNKRVTWNLDFRTGEVTF